MHALQGVIYGALGYIFYQVCSFLHLTAGRESFVTRNVVETTLLKMDNYIRVLTAIRQRLQNSLVSPPEIEAKERDISSLFSNLKNVVDRPRYRGQCQLCGCRTSKKW